jgi:uncharacterized membrane protein
MVALLLVSAAGPTFAHEDHLVRGVFFYSPDCVHCHDVIDNELPGIFEANGGALDTPFQATDSDPAFTIIGNGTLELLMVNVLTEDGASLYDTATIEFGIPDEMLGVPRLVVGTEFSVGGRAVPADLRRLVDESEEPDGFDWPDLTGLDVALATIFGVVPEPVLTPTETTVSTTQPEAIAPLGEETTTTTVASAATTATTTTTVGPFPIGNTPGGTDGIGEPLNTIGDKFRNDIPGNTLAVVVLAGMLASLAAVWILVRKGRLASSPVWLIPVLAVAGALVAIYLTYVESSGADAVCGPVGDCNAVQESKFALLFGIVHVGLVGLISYIVVFATWLVSRLAKAPLADWATVALALGAAGGVAFSIYLTFLEPFVIGATCIWCIASALIVTALLWLTAGPGWAAWRRLRTDAA